MMSLSAERSDSLKMHPKRLDGNRENQFRDFPSNFKRQKADCVCPFPRGCGSRAKAVDRTVAIGDAKVAEERNVAEAAKQNVAVKPEAPKGLEKRKSVDVAEKTVERNRIDALGDPRASTIPGVPTKKFPPMKVWKGVPVDRKYPPIAENRAVSTTTKSVVNRISGKKSGGMVFDRKFEENFEKKSSEGRKRQRSIDADEAKPVVLKNQVETEKPRQNSTEKNSLVVITRSANRFSRRSLEKIAREHSLVKTSFDFGNVSFDDFEEVMSRNKVKEALNLFEEIYCNLLREHELKSKEEKRSSNQIHSEAARILREQHKWVNVDKKYFGPIPGVKVGDKFHFRVELAIVGLHSPYRGGIDFVNKNGSLFATSIVASGHYANYVGSPDVLIYSGQGGNPLVACNKLEDQKLEKGNLALKNSMDAGFPVRVIRGKQTFKKSRITARRSERREKTFIYDGLYVVTECRQERGCYGKLVFMFRLNRIPGQPKLMGTRAWKSENLKLSKKLCVVDDISGGMEKIPIRAINIVDDDKPPLFRYSTNMKYVGLCNFPISKGCDCINGCLDSENCSCARRNRGEIPNNNNGAIIRAKPIIYECGPLCKCPLSCKNRVSQQGIRYQLEVFKTEYKGWGVRSRNYISIGSFICEYIGELLTYEEAEQRVGCDEYLFDIGSFKDNDGGVFSHGNNDGFTIDASQIGNVGRFINHSCTPNLYTQVVLCDHGDIRVPHIMFFSMKNIPPLRELTFDYNYKVDQVRDVHGIIKKKKCWCGSNKCVGRMY